MHGKADTKISSGKRSFGKPGNRKDDTIKTGLTEVAFEVVDQLQLLQDWIQWQVLCEYVINIYIT
jgi:hypothetical protein